MERPGQGFHVRPGRRSRFVRDHRIVGRPDGGTFVRERG